jgi:guanylate kinase
VIVEGHQTQRGRLIVLAAPSGAGKTTLVHALLARVPDLVFSVSYTTRAARADERDGHDYFFVSKQEFTRMVEAGAFLEHAQVFDHWYGTGMDHVDEILRRGRSVLLEIDWQGARQVKRRSPEACTVFILPPSIAELERRLRGRGTDSEERITRRLRDALGDISHWSEFDYAVVNERVDEAVNALAAIIGGQGEAHSTQSARLRARITEILAS